MADPFNPAPGSDVGPASPVKDQDRPVMDTMELRLATLAARGFSVSIGVRESRPYEDLKGIIFSATLRKEAGRYGQGGRMEASGDGLSLDEAVGAALAAAEAFLDHPGPPAAVKAAQIDMAKALPMGAAE